METAEERVARIAALEGAREIRSGRVEQRKLTRSDLPKSMLGEPLPGDVAPLSIRDAERLPDVRRAVNIYASIFALMPLRAWRETPEGLVPADGPAAELLARPTSWQSASAWRAHLGATLARRGEAFIGLTRDAVDRVVQLRLLDPSAMEVEIQGGDPRYTLHTADRGPQRLTTADIVHVLGPMSRDGIRGTSPIEDCAPAVALVRALGEHALETFTSGSIPPAVLRVAATGPGADEQMANLASVWRDRRRGNVAVVNGEIAVEKLGYANGEAQFIEVARWATELVARAFGLPAAALGESTGGTLDYTNVQAMLERMATLDLRPWLECVADAFSVNRELFPGRTRAAFALGDVPLDPSRGWGSDATPTGGPSVAERTTP